MNPISRILRWLQEDENTAQLTFFLATMLAPLGIILLAIGHEFLGTFFASASFTCGVISLLVHYVWEPSRDEPKRDEHGHYVKKDEKSK